MTADSVLSALIEVKGAREAIRAAESVQGALREARNEAVLATNAVNRFGRTRGIAVLDVDSAKANAQLQAADKQVREYGREHATATLDADAGRVRLVTADATRQVRQFGATKATAVLDTDTSKVAALGGELRRAGSAVNGLGSNFDGLHKSKSKTDTLIDKNVGTFGKLSQSIRGTGTATSGLGSSFGPLSGGLSGLGAAALFAGVSLLAIAGPAIAVVAALGPLIGLTAAVAGGLLAAAQGFAVFKLATAGIGDALKEQATASRTAGSTALAQAGQQVSAARAIQGAQEALRGAREATARASRAVDEATRSERQAIAALGPAYTEARTRIRDLRDAVTGANLSLRDARFAANDARKALTDLLGGPSPRQLADAHLAVADAMRGERSAALGLADATKALNDLLSPPAVLDLADARDAVADATRGQTRAQLDLAKQLTATNDVLADPGASDADKADARLRLADAENAVGDAARTSARAQEALSKLESPAAQDEIAKARSRVQDAEAAVATAKRDTLDAQAALAKVESPAASDEIAKARLALAQAEQQLSVATRDGARAASEYRTAEAQGIAQSPSVLAAREQLRSAALAGADAERALTNAQRAQGLAARGVSEAQADAARSAGVAAAAATNLSQKFDALPPAAQAFVRVLQSLKPRLDELRSTAASGFFPGATAGLKAAEGSFGAINSVVGETSLVLGDAARKSGELVGSPAFAADIQTIGSNNAKVLGTFGEALRHIISAFRHVIVAAGPLTQWLADVANKWALNAAESAKAGRETGKLAAFFDRTREVAQRLGSILGRLGSGLLGVGKAGTTTGNDILKSIDRAAKRFDEWANSVKGQNSIREFFQKTRDIAAQLLPALGNLAKGFGTLALRLLPVTTALRLLGPYADEAVIAFVAYKLAVTAVSAATVIAKGAMFAAKAAVVAWTGAQWLLNAALDANPIGLVVIALLAIGAGLIYAYKHSETFRDIVDGAFKVVSKAFGWLLQAAKDAFGWLKDNWPLVLAILTGPIGLAVLAIVKYGDDILAFFKALPGKIVDALKAAGSALLDAGKWVIDQIVAGLQAVGGALSSVGTWLKDQVSTLIRNEITGLTAIGSWILDQIIAGFKAVTGALSSVGSWLKDQAETFIHNEITGLTAIGSWLLDRIVDGFKAVTGLLSSVGGWIRDRFVEFIHKEIEGIKAIGGWILDKIVGGFKAITDLLSSVGGWLKNRFVEFIQAEIEGVKAIGSWVLNRIVDGFKVVTELLGTVGGWLKNRFEELVHLQVDALKSLGSWVLNRVVDGFTTVTDALGGIGGWLSEHVSKIIHDIGGDFKDLGGFLIDKIVDGLKGGANLLVDFLNDVIDVIKKVPGVDIGHVAKFAEGGEHSTRAAAATQGMAHGGAFARTGGFVNSPITLMGEEAPCIAYGTLIATTMGQRPIQDVAVGERVLTRNGYRPVVWSGITRRDAEVLRITSVDGDNVLCTPDHRVWAASGGRDGNGGRDCMGGGPVRRGRELPRPDEQARQPVRRDASGHDLRGPSEALAGCRGCRAGNRAETSWADGHEADVLGGCVFPSRREARDPRVSALAGRASHGQGPGDAGAHRVPGSSGRAASDVLPAWASALPGNHLCEPEGLQHLPDLQARQRAGVEQGEVRNQPGACTEGARRGTRGRSQEARRPGMERATEGAAPGLVSPDEGWREAQSLRVGDWIWTLDADGGLTPAQIASIHAEERIDTYDLMVADDHEFVAGGILVHNSHPEFVIPTNPAYRGRAQMLLGQAAGAIGLAQGGVHAFAKGGRYSQGDMEALWKRHGGGDVKIAGAVGMAESGGDPNAGRQHPYHGLWQVGPGGSFDPDQNAIQAIAKWRAGGNNVDARWKPWEAYTGPDGVGSDGPWRQFIGKGGGGGIGGAIKGLLGNVGGVIGDLLSKGAGFLLDKLPGIGNLPDFLKGTGTYVLDKASGYIKDKVGNLLSSVTGGNAGDDLPKGVSGSISDAIGLAQSLGFARPSIGQLTGGQHAKGSYHFQGRAADFGDAGHSAKQMDALYDALRSRFGANIKELFYDTQPSYVKNGKSIAGQFGGHGDHIHIALAKGGIYGGGLLGSYAAGTDYVPQTGPYLLHKGESVAPAAQGGDEYGRGNVIITGPVTMRTDQQASVLAEKLAFRLRYS